MLSDPNQPNDPLHGFKTLFLSHIFGTSEIRDFKLSVTWPICTF